MAGIIRLIDQLHFLFVKAFTAIPLLLIPGNKFIHSREVIHSYGALCSGQKVMFTESIAV